MWLGGAHIHDARRARRLCSGLVLDHSSPSDAFSPKYQSERAVAAMLLGGRRADGSGGGASQLTAGVDKFPRAKASS